MTRFSPNNNQHTPDEWSAIALQKNSNNNIQYTTIGGIALSMWVGASAGWMAGLVVLAWSIYTCVQSAKKSGQQCDAIVEDGCIAQVLPAREFNAYRRQVGDQQILEELRFAQLEGLQLSPHSQNFLEEFGSSIKPSTNVLSPGMKSANPPNEVVTETQGDSLSDSDRLLNQFIPCENSIFVGLPASGKGVLVSNAIRKLKAEIPGFGVYFIDPKASYRELDYWMGVCDIYERRNCEDLDSATVVAWVQENFAKYNQWHAARGGQSLLVLDEGWLVATKCETAKTQILKDKIISLSSLGNEAGKSFWVMSQTPFMGALGLDLSTGASMVVYAIVRGGNAGTLRSWNRATAIATIKNEDSQILLENSECDRILYNGKTGRWQSMPVLPNYSGWNRDKREYEPETQKLIALWQASTAETIPKFLEEIGCPKDGLSQYEKILKKILAADPGLKQGKD